MRPPTFAEMSESCHFQVLKVEQRRQFLTIISIDIT